MLAISNNCHALKVGECSPQLGTLQSPVELELNGPGKEPSEINAKAGP